MQGTRGLDAPRPRSRARGRVASGTVLAVASFGAFLAFLDATIVNVAFPSIRASFPGSSISDLSWVLNGYNIVFAAFLVVAGRATDLIGRRRAFVSGVVLFTAASAVCAAAGSVGFLVAMRGVQALGAALLVPASLAVVIEAFSPEHRAHAIGLWGASAAVASGLGPPIGGALVQAGGWRWAFLVNIPFGIAALVAARGKLVESRAPGRRTLPDIRGAILLALGLGLLTLGIVQGSDWGWTSIAVLGSFAGAAACFVGFVVSSRAHRSPLLDPALLRIRSFTVGNATTLLAGMGFYAYLLTNILWLQYVWGYSVFTAGLATVPGALVAAVVAAVLGPVAARRGYRWVVVPGAVIWMLAYVWYVAKVPVQPDFLGAWLPGQILSGIGVGCTLPVLGSATLAAVPGGRYATASAVVSSARQVGGVLGIAILVVILGTPTPATAVTVFRHGWVFSAMCFAVVALVALGLGRIDGAQHGDVDADLAAGARALAPATPEPDRSPTGPTAGWAVFPELPVATRDRLTQAARTHDLVAGQTLFEQGDPAHAVYVVRSGRLVVLDGTDVVRELGPGAVLGELGVLTDEPRSATVRARRDSRLLEVPRAEVLDALAAEPAAMAAVTRTLARQLAQARPAAAGTPTPAVVAVVATHPGAPAAAVGHALVDALAPFGSVVAPGVVDAAGLERLEESYDRTVLVADATAADWTAFCLRQADHVLLVADHAAAAPDRALPVTAPDLVLVGGRADPARIDDWRSVVAPWHVTSTSAQPSAVDLRAVAARLAGRSVGVVLAGGGARALAGIGVLAALEENGVVVDRVAGCSVGAVVAGLYAQGLDPAAITEVCYSEFVRRNPFADYTVPTRSFARGKRARHAVSSHLGGHPIEALPRLFRTTSTDLLRRTQVVHDSGDLGRAVLASLSLPGLLPPLPDGDRLLVDGGVLDNLPVSVLTQRHEGPVIAVNIALGGDGTRARSGPPRVPALPDTLLRTMLIGSAGAVERARALGASVVTPATLGVGLLEFHQLDRVVAAGRAAGEALLAVDGDRLFSTGHAAFDLRAESGLISDLT